jgi:hypothetical protein
MTGCESGFLDCTVEAGCETDPMTEAAHCGGCGDPCGFGQRCVASACGLPTVEDVLVFPSNRDVGVGGLSVDAADNIYMSVRFEVSVDLPGGTVSGGDFFRPASALFKLSPTYTREWVYVVESSGPVGAISVAVRDSGVSFFAGNAVGSTLTLDTTVRTHASLTQALFMWSFDPSGSTRWLRNLWASGGASRSQAVSPGSRERRREWGGCIAGNGVRFRLHAATEALRRIGGSRVHPIHCPTPERRDCVFRAVR